MPETPPSSDRWYGRPTWHAIALVLFGFGLIGLGVVVQNLGCIVVGGIHTLTLSIHAARLFPTYRAGETGLLVRGVIRTRTFPWGEVEALVKFSKGDHEVVTNRGPVTLSSRIVDGEQLVQQIERSANVQTVSVGSYSGEDCRAEFGSRLTRGWVAVFLLFVGWFLFPILRDAFGTTPGMRVYPSQAAREWEDVKTLLLSVSVLFVGATTICWFLLRCPNCSSLQVPPTKHTCSSCRALLKG